MADIWYGKVLTTNANRYDVVILGGGVAGTSTALALLNQGISNILVLESGSYAFDRLGESLPPNIRVPFDRLGIWEDFVNEKQEPCYGSCSSWGTDELGYNDFLFNPLGNGWHVDRRRFDMFLARMATQRGIKLWTNTRFKAAQKMGHERYRLSLQDSMKRNATIDARFIVDATGHRGRFATRHGAQRIHLDKLFIVAAYFHLPNEAPFPRQTMLEAVEYGWWYAAMLPGSRAVLNVATDLAIVKQKKLHTQAGLLTHLAETRHLSKLLEYQYYVKDSLKICLAPSFRLDDPVGENWIAVGDAASAYDPISSQGIYKAISNGLEAGTVIAAGLAGDNRQEDPYRESIASSFEIFARNRDYFYAIENRWPDAPFWRRRRQSVVSQ